MKDGTWMRRVLAIAMAVAILAGVTAAVPAAAADNAGWDYRLVSSLQELLTDLPQ